MEVRLAARCRCGWRRHLRRSHVADVVVRLDRPLLANQAVQGARGGLGAGEAGDGDVLPLSGDLDGQAGMREVQAGDVRGLKGTGLGAAVSPLPGLRLPAGTCCQGRTLTWACSSG